MSLLIESIRLLDGKFDNLFYHELRMRDSLSHLCGVDEDLDLEAFLSNFQFPKQQLFKCRITYDDVIKEVEFIPYTLKSIKSLQIVESNNISYDYKFKDRRKIDELYEMRRECDDILIIKNDMVTDSSYSNIVFKRNDRWITPWSALLKGTMRQYLLDRELIQEENIRKEDIPSFESFKLINAMFGFDGPENKISNIIF